MAELQGVISHYTFGCQILPACNPQGYFLSAYTTFYSAVSVLYWRIILPPVSRTKEIACQINHRLTRQLHLYTTLALWPDYLFLPVYQKSIDNLYWTSYWTTFFVSFTFKKKCLITSHTSLNHLFLAMKNPHS